MGQSSSQRQLQHQDVELWELYEEEYRGGAGRNPNRNAVRDNRGRSAGRSYGNSADRPGSRSYGSSIDRSGGRSYGSSADRSGGRSYGSSADRSGGRRPDSRNRAAERRSSMGSRPGGTGGGGGRRGTGRGSSSYGRDTERTRSRRDDRSSSGNIMMYEMRQRDVHQRPRSGSFSAPRRQSVSAARSGRSVNLEDTLQISYIEPYADTQTRRRSQEQVYSGNARPVRSIKRRRARRRREFLCKAIIVLFMAACLGMIYFFTGQIYRMVHRKEEAKPVPVVAEQPFDMEESSDGKIAPPNVMQDFLEINEFSRPGDKLSKVNSIFVHYTANPGTSAAQNRSYFANLAETQERSASAHFIIGYEGELIQCIPLDEQAYAVMTRNEDSVSIECCYLSEDGSFTQETYDTLIHTLAWLVDQFDLSTEDILRHYDCGGKLCPLYYAENEGEWQKLKQDVSAYLIAAE